MFAIGIFTGMRLGDVCSLKWSAVDLGAGIIEIAPKKTERTGKKVRLPILPPLAKLLHELNAVCPSQRYLFPAENKIYNTDSSPISRRIQKHFHACGIETTEQPKPGRRQMPITRVGFHSLRHSFVSILVKNKVPQTAISALVGHGSPLMTENYTHLDDEQRVEAISGISKLITFDTEKAG
jgi:integrase